MLTEFQRRAHHVLPSAHLPNSTAEWLAMMQHYGAPTRFLDWTRSPFVAAYFALEDAPRDGRCAIWCLNQAWCLKYARQYLGRREPDLEPHFDPSQEAFFGKHLLSGAHQFVVPIEPFRLHERMTTQQGLFACPGDVDVSFMKNLQRMGDALQHNLTQVTIPNIYRGLALAELNKMNINRATLFPGIDGLARSLKYRLVEASPLLKALSQTGTR
jgi:hypothetical protein